MAAEDNDGKLSRRDLLKGLGGLATLGTGFATRALGLAALGAAALPALPRDAFASGENPLARTTRILHLYNQNTGEKISAAYVQNGQTNLRQLERLDWFLRDWRQGKAIAIDERLYDVLYVLQELFLAETPWPIGITSGHRTKATNDGLRERIPGVAKNSLHVKGQAIDFWIPSRPPSEAARFLLKWGFGGVGLYPRWIHVDTGNPRFWRG